MSTPNENLAPAEALAVIEQSLADAIRKGADAAEASISAGSGLSVTVRRGELETVEHHRDKTLAIVVFKGQCKGSASTTDFSAAAVARTVTAAVDAARFTSEDPWAGLARAEELAAAPLPDLDLCHPWALDAGAAETIARACESAAFAADPRIANSEGATVNRHRGLQAYGNSNGFSGCYQASRHGISCVVIAGSGDGMQRDHWYSVARHPGSLGDAAAIGAEAARRTVARLNARRLPTRRAPILFEAPIASSLFGHLTAALGGAAQYRQASFLLGAQGSRVFPAWLRIDEDPFIRRGLASCPFDMDGIAPRPRPLIEDGVVRGYVLDVYAARRLGMATTGNAGGVHNLLVSHGDQDLAALLGSMGTGLLVTELIGFGVNPVTGDYSRGVAGFWVEQGEIAYPVEEITIAGNLKDMYRGIAAIGLDVDQRHTIQTGSVLIDGMMIAGGES